MGFKAVYQTLRELFPQMDARLLKAVAIEHSKDPDAAVEYILNVVLLSTEDDKPTEPVDYLTGDGDIAYRPSFDGHNLDNDSFASSFYDANESHEQLNGNPKSDLAYLNAYEETGFESHQDGSSGVMDATGLGTLKGGSSEALGDLNCVSSVASQDQDTNTLVGMSIKENPSVDPNTLECEVSTESAIKDPMPSSSRWNSNPNAENYSNLGIDITEEMNRFLYDASVPSVSVEDGEADVNVQQDCSNDSSSCVPELTLVSESIKEKPSVNHNTLECDVSTESAIKDQMPSASRCNSHHNDDSESNLGFDINQEIDSFPSSEFTREFPETDAIGAENGTLLSTIVTRSGQICRINLLEDIVEEAKNYKDTVCSAMESVVRLMEEVELKENEAEEAKVASVNGGLEILQKVEDIKKMLVHAKEANDMHSGEVYGEKSILATEVKELQARLFGLSDEKDRSLMMLDEMRNSLEDRLAVAEEQRRAAEKEIYDKQEVAQGALAEQELLMAKIVQDSKLLQQEAEENAKLRDFLVEKGQLVDVLQGEISVICQDVKLLKENFDNRVPLSKSFSIEQTSYRLASSNSSVKSSASLKSTTSLKSTASLKSTLSVKSIASDASVHSTDQIKLPESPASVNQELSGDWQSEGAEVGEKYATHETTATKPVSDDEWELCDM